MNRARFAGLMGILTLALGGLTPARAAEDAGPQTYVVVVGIADYADKQIKPRPHAEADAKALYDVCVNPDYLGVDAQHIRLLLGATKETGSVDDHQRVSEPATRAGILKGLQWAVDKAKRDDLVLFAFIGEGAPLGDRTCYFASDSTFKNRAKTAVTALEIERDFDKLKSQKFFAFLDVDFNGFEREKGPAAGKEAAPELNRQKLYQEFFGSKQDPDEDEHAARSNGRILFLSNTGRTPSLDLEKHGLFTQVVVAGLKGAADADGYEPDGHVTWEELKKYLEKELPILTKKHGKTDEQKKPTATVIFSLSTQFDLVKNPKALPKVLDRIAKIDKLLQDDKITKVVAEEGRNLLQRMPKLKARQALRKDYQQLADGGLAVADFLKDRQKVLDGMKMEHDDAVDFARAILKSTRELRDSYVKPVNQGELIVQAIRGLYRQLAEELPQDIRDQLAKAKELKEDKLLKLLTDAREHLGKREDLDNHKDVNATMRHMLRHLDPFTSYIDPEMKSRFETETQGRFTGIGVKINQIDSKDMLRVVTPIKGSPAYKQGIKTDDIITTITREVDSDGKELDPPEVISTKGMIINDAVKKILGKPGTKVKITVEREGAPEPITFELRRGQIEMESVYGVRYKKDDSWEYFIDPTNKIAYIRITSFTHKTDDDLRQVVSSLSEQGMRGLVLDLRFNPGGLLASANRVCDLFIDDGLIVTIRPRAGTRAESSEYGEHDGSFLDFPMVVLINDMSASGSEIVAACLQDHNRAVIMGERSYGKGSVQNIIPLESRTSALKLTTATYWRPSGKNIHRFPDSKPTDEWGVSPDKGYVIKLTATEQNDELHKELEKQDMLQRRDVPSKETKPAFKDKQLDVALRYLRDQIKLIKLVSRVPVKKAG